MKYSIPLLLILAVSLTVAACGDSDTVDAGAADAAAGRDAVTAPDANENRDANENPDAEAPDGEAPDTGAEDSGPADSGPGDTGEVDSGQFDSGLPDGGLPDSGPLDSGPTDSGPADTGEGDSGPLDGGALLCPCTFTEEFVSFTNIDPTLTTAVIDPPAPGHAIANAPHVFLSNGTGAGGVFAPIASQTLAGGSYDFESVDIPPGVTIDVAGDLDLRVQNTFTISGDSELSVTGNLTLVAGSTITVDCAYVNAGGNITLHQPSAGGVHVICGDTFPYSEIATQSPTTGSSGNLEIWTRGPLVLGDSGYLLTGRVIDPSGRSGTITVRAYGDVTLGPGEAYFIAGESMGANGDIFVYTEGRVVLDLDSYFICSRSNGTIRDGGTITIRAKQNVELHRDSYFITSPQGDIDIITEADVILEADSYLLTQRNGATPTDLRIRARALHLAGDPTQLSSGGYVIANNSTTGGGDVIIDVREGIIMLDDSYIGVSDATCGPGGNIFLSTEGNLDVLGDSFIDAGSSLSDGACPLQPGGNVTIVTGGIVNAMPVAIAPGNGSVTGTVTISINANYQLGILDAGLVQTTLVESLPLLLEGGMTRVLTATAAGALEPAFWSSAHLYLSPDGLAASFVPAHDVEVPLQPGWRYRFELGARMFDATRADSFSVTYE